MAAAANTDDPDTSIPLGSTATLAFAAAVPITAVAASSAREHPQVKGLPAARIAGWIGYGLTIADAMVLIGLGLAEEEVSPGVVISVATLGAVSTSAMVADAFASASQADAKASGAPIVGEAPSLQLAPRFAVLPDPRGGAEGYAGLVATF